MNQVEHDYIEFLGWDWKPYLAKLEPIRKKIGGTTVDDPNWIITTGPDRNFDNAWSKVELGCLNEAGHKWRSKCHTSFDFIATKRVSFAFGHYREDQSLDDNSDHQNNRITFLDWNKRKCELKINDFTFGDDVPRKVKFQITLLP